MATRSGLDLAPPTTRTAAWPLVGWTIFVWISRIRNVLADDDLDGAGTAWRLVAAGIFLLLGTATAMWVVRGVPTFALAALSAWSVGFWLVRGIGILLDSNHDAGFKAIHTALMIVTFALVALAWRGSRAEEPGST